MRLSPTKRSKRSQLEISGRPAQPDHIDPPNSARGLLLLLDHSAVLKVCCEGQVQLKQGIFLIVVRLILLLLL